jgi:hypothetical protein
MQKEGGLTSDLRLAAASRLNPETLFLVSMRRLREQLNAEALYVCRYSILTVPNLVEDGEK